MPDADSTLFGSFNGALPDMEANFGELWRLDRTGVNYQAIAMDRETATSQAMSGGKYIDATSMLFVRNDVVELSGVKKGDIVVARGERFTVRSLDKDGDDSRTLILGPVSIDVWK